MPTTPASPASSQAKATPVARAAPQPAAPSAAPQVVYVRVSRWQQVKNFRAGMWGLRCDFKAFLKAEDYLPDIEALERAGDPMSIARLPGVRDKMSEAAKERREEWQARKAKWATRIRRVASCGWPPAVLAYLIAYSVISFLHSRPKSKMDAPTVKAMFYAAVWAVVLAAVNLTLIYLWGDHSWRSYAYASWWYLLQPGILLGAPLIGILWLCGWVWHNARYDATVADNLPGVVHHAPDVVVDDRYNNIVAGFAAVLRLKPDHPIVVIGAGLEPVDPTWSRMRLQFPGSLTNDRILKAVPGVASIMGVSTERLDAVPVEDDAGREIEGVIDVYYANGQPRQIPTWPILDTERASVWDRVPFLVPDRGDIITVLALFASWLFVAIPRHGKTFAMRLLAFVYALDPTVDYAVFDFKDHGVDWRWAEPTAAASGYGKGDANVKALRDYLQWVLDERHPQMGRLFEALPKELRPDGQLTRAACDHEPRIRPLGIFIDEVHVPLMHPEYGKEITNLLGRVERELSFLAVTAYIASQAADVKTSIPEEVRAHAANRVAGKLYSATASRAILGDAAREMGYSAKNLRPVKGLFILHGIDDTASADGYTRGRAFFVDGLQADELAERAYRLRQAAGVLPDQPAPAEPPPPELIEVLALVREHGVERPSGRVSMRSEDVAVAMGTTPQRLLAKIKVRSHQERSDGNLKHLYLDELEAAAAGRRPALRVVS